MVLLLWSNFKNSQTSQLKALWVVNPSTEPTISFHPFPSISIEVNCWNTPFFASKTWRFQKHPTYSKAFGSKRHFQSGQKLVAAKIETTTNWKAKKIRSTPHGRSLNPLHRNGMHRNDQRTWTWQNFMALKVVQLVGWLVGEKRQLIELFGGNLQILCCKGNRLAKL